MVIPTEKTALSAKAKLFRGFGDPSRLSILESLVAGPMNVMEIVTATGLSQPNVSSHLSCLRDCGLVTMTQQGRFVIYQLGDPRVTELLDLAGSLIADTAKGIYDCSRYGLVDRQKQNEHKAT